MPPIALGQEFNTLADFKAALRTWSIDEGFVPAILDSDARRVRIGCRTTPDCPFRVRCNFDHSRNKARVSTLVSRHTCQASLAQGNDNGDPIEKIPVVRKTTETNSNGKRPIRGEVTKLRFLIEAVPRLMIVDQATRTRDIIKNIKARYGQQISMRQAQKLKSTLLSIASDQLGEGLYKKMRESLGEDATEEEMRRGKRLRADDEMIDPRLFEGENADDQDDTQGSDFQDHDDTQTYDFQDNDEYGDDFDEDNYEDQDYVDAESDHQSQYERQTTHNPRYDKVIDDVSQMESNIEQVLDQATEEQGPTAAELRAQAAAMFQQASRKFQEATQLHMQAAKLFSTATEMEHQSGEG